MAAWFSFILEAVGTLVNTVFSLQLGLGFSLGDLMLALMVLTLISSAFLIRIRR